MMMMIVALRVCQSLETQMATFFYSFLSFCYDTEMFLLRKSPRQYLHLSRSAHLFPYLSTLQFVISMRLPLLMGDVNHRRA